MGKSATTAVPENAVFAALGAMAAVIEEAHCFVGSDELRKLVSSHGRLSDAVGFKRDYRYIDGQALCAGTVVKDARHGQ